MPANHAFVTDTPRYTAFSILEAVRRDHQTLNIAVDRFLENGRLLSRRDRALVGALTYGVMRRRGELDWIIDYFSNTPLSKINPPVLNILRLGVYQIKYMDRIPDSAAVNTAVEMAKAVSENWIVRFVNGVLRNVAREAATGFSRLPSPDPRKNPVEALALRHAFPKWLINRWLKRYGLARTEQLCVKSNQIPPLTVRVNTLKTKRSELMAALAPETRNLEPTPYSVDGLAFDHPSRSLPEADAFKNGWFQVQDEAAQLIAPLMNPTAGERVLDACAGLGGKTGHIAQLMQNHGELVALDHDAHKLKKLMRAMQRLGLGCIRPEVCDLNHPPDAKRFGRFDKVLVDAPCSGLGVIRRNPDTKWSESKKNLTRYSARQIRFLDHVAPLVKPSGILVFAVCSMEPEENEIVVKKFLEDHPEFDIEHSCGKLPVKAEELMDDNGFLRTLPHLHDMDGFFAVRLKRMS